LLAQDPCAGEPFPHVSVVPPQQFFFSQHTVVFPPQVPVLSLHSTPQAHAFSEQLLDVASRRLRRLPEVLALSVAYLGVCFFRFRLEQQLSRLRAMRALQIHPITSKVVAYRSCAALRCFLHGFLPGPKGWVPLEQQPDSVEVEPSIHYKRTTSSVLWRNSPTFQVLFCCRTIVALRVTFLLRGNFQAGT